MPPLVAAAVLKRSSSHLDGGLQTRAKKLRNRQTALATKERKRKKQIGRPPSRVRTLHPFVRGLCAMVRRAGNTLHCATATDTAVHTGSKRVDSSISCTTLYCIDVQI